MDCKTICSTFIRLQLRREIFMVRLKHNALSAAAVQFWWCVSATAVTMGTQVEKQFIMLQ